MGQRRKRRLPVNYSSTSAHCGGRKCTGAAEGRLHTSSGLSKNLRPRGTDSERPHRFVLAQPEGWEWEAVQEMFLALRSRFVGLAYTILRNRDDAEDAVQDAFLLACRHLRTFEGRSTFTTWFTRIVVNAALMMRRKRKPSWTQLHPESRTMDDTPWTERIPASQPDPEMVCAEGETLQLMDVLLGNMSPILRQSFTMTYYDELTSREACTVLGVSIGTFKSRIFRARRHLMHLAQRSLVAPIRRAAHSPFSFGRPDFQALAARPSAT